MFTGWSKSSRTLLNQIFFEIETRILVFQNTRIRESAKMKLFRKVLNQPSIRPAKGLLKIVAMMGKSRSPPPPISCLILSVKKMPD